MINVSSWLKEKFAEHLPKTYSELTGIDVAKDNVYKEYEEALKAVKENGYHFSERPFNRDYDPETPPEADQMYLFEKNDGDDTVSILPYGEFFLIT